MGDGTTVYHVFSGSQLVARAVLRFFKSCIDDVLVYKESDRRRGIASALYKLIEADLASPCVRAGLGPRRGGRFGRAGAEPRYREFRNRPPRGGRYLLCSWAVRNC